MTDPWSGGTRINGWRRGRLLGEQCADLARQLKDLRGRLEVRIRANYDEPRLLAEILRADPDIAKLRQQIKRRPEDATSYGRIRLGELVVGAVERVRERVVFNASFLVDRERLEEFDALLTELAAKHASRARFKYTGPLPPYSFVQLARSA